jgi:hypothetical protein
MTSRPPRIWARGTDRPAGTGDQPHKLIGDDKLIAVIYAPKAQVAKWVENELDRDGAVVQTARDLPQLMKTLIEDQAERPNVLVVDVDAITPGELMELHSLRERGWFGTIIGLGNVPVPLKTSLGIDHAIRPPFVRDQLRDAVVALREPGATIPIPMMRDKPKPDR